MALTREQVLEMGAGREMDRLVGELVMGLEIVEDTLPQLPKYFVSGYDRTVFMDVPKYSTEISAAWEVVEKLDKEVTVKRYEAMSGFRYWCRVNGMDPNKFDEIIANGLTAPEAICKAALLTTIGEGTE